MAEVSRALQIDRRRRLAEAHRARNQRRERRAIALYKSILLEDPSNTEVALRVAPLLARRGEAFEAWQLFRAAARDLARSKRWEECLAVYRDACFYVPHEFDAWRLRAELELRLGREECAYETLLDGAMVFKHPSARAQAVALLSRARFIEPWDPEVVLDLARMHARSDMSDAALDLLAGLAPRVRGADLRRVRALEWRTTLSFRGAWLWFEALCEEWFGGSREPAPPPLRALDSVDSTRGLGSEAESIEVLDVRAKG